MIIKIKNRVCKVIIGGKDNLLPFDIHQELRDYLAVLDPNRYFAPSYPKRWDGYHRFYTDVRKEFPTGMLPLVLDFLDSKGNVEVSIEDERDNLPEFIEEPVRTFGEIDLKKYPYDYQLPLIEKTNRFINYRGTKIYFPRGVWDAATNAGKTVMVEGLIRNLVNPRVLFLVQDLDLFVQTVNFFEEFREVGMIKPRFNKHPIARFKGPRFEIKDFTVAMTQTLKAKVTGKEKLNTRKALKHFNTLIVDECHEAINKTHKKAIEAVDAGVRIYISGTPFDMDDKKKKLELVGMSGPSIAKVENKELIERGVSRDPIIDIYLNHTTTNQLIHSYAQEMYMFVHYSKERADLIAREVYNDAMQGKYVMVTFFELEHGQFMYDALMNYKDDYNVPTEIVSGADEYRFEKVRRFLDKHTRVLFSSIILRKGMNIKHLNTLVNAVGGKSKSGIKQWVGRALRQNDFFDRVRVVDFFDVGSTLSTHSRKRIKLYQEQYNEVNLHFELSKTRGLSNRLV